MIPEIINDFLSPEQSKEILVLGCGSGSLLHKLATENPRTRFVAIGFGQSRRCPPNLEYRKTILPTLPFPTDQFEGSICFNALACYGKSSKLLSEISRVLSPKAKILFIETTSFRDHLFTTLRYFTKGVHFSSEESLRIFLSAGFPNTAILRVEDRIVGICRNQ